MNTKSFLGGAVLASLSLLNANAVDLVNENFDGYLDQAAFVAAWPVVGATPSGALQGTNWVSAARGVYFGTIAQRNGLTFTETGLPDSTLNLITFSFDFYDSNAALSPYRQFVNLQDTAAPSATSQLIAMGLNNNQTSANSGGNYYMGRILGFTPTLVDPNGGPNEDGVLSAGSFFKLNDFGVGLRSTGWHNLRVVISSDDG